jgi:hypothetical protein
MGKKPKRSRTPKAVSRQRRRQRQLQEAAPRLGHETMLRFEPVRNAVNALVKQHAVAPEAEPTLVCEDRVMDCPEVDDMVKSRLAVARHVFGWDNDECMSDFEQLITHTICAANFQLAGRKAFWVSEILAEQLRQTDIDVSGEALQLPFPACAFCFRDSGTLELFTAAARNAQQPFFKALTVYVFPSIDGDEHWLKFCFLADRYDGEWPYLIARDVITQGARNLDEILDSHPEESSDPAFFGTPELKALVKLVVNAVLYTTSSSFHSEKKDPLKPTWRSQAQPLTGETVYYLPGKIQIDHEAQRNGHQEDMDLTPARSVLKRFWVRGHWRRPNPSWKDQRLRWIKPYLKGPDVAAIVERQYQLGSASRG